MSTDHRLGGRKRGSEHCSFLRESISGKGNNRRGGPETEECLACLMNSRKPVQLEQDESSGKEEEGKQPEVEDPVGQHKGFDSYSESNWKLFGVLSRRGIRSDVLGGS